MPTHFRDTVIRCDNCSANIPRPRPGAEYQAVYAQGWRLRSNPNERPLRFAPHTMLVSCPDCPPVAD